MSQYYYLMVLLPLFLVFIIFINYILLREIYYYLTFDNWNTTEGLIIESKIEQDAEYGKFFDVTYEYIVNTKKYKSKKINLGNILWFSFMNNKTNKYKDKYPLNKHVKVYYHPKKHKISCLEKTSLAPSLFALFISLLFLILFIILIYKFIIFMGII
jgi:hypothetical protein